MSKVYVVGHKNPDNDAIMSAVMFAQLAGTLDKDNEYVACRQGGLPGETQALLQANGIAEPELLERIEASEPKCKVILTDHNELAQTVDGIENAEVVAVIDHHRIADLSTAQPIYFVNMPWGSSCTVIARLFETTGVEMTKEQATCLLSAMMTDTVMLKSPTTTDVDREMAAKLGAMIGRDPVEFGAEVFRSRGADGFTPAQMVSRDIKRFEIGGKAVYIGQYETVNKQPVLEQVRRAPRGHGAVPRRQRRRHAGAAGDRHHRGGLAGVRVRRSRHRREGPELHGQPAGRVDARRAFAQEAGGRPAHRGCRVASGS